MTKTSAEQSVENILHIVLIEDQDVDKIMIEQAFSMLEQPVILHIYSDGEEALKEIRTSAQVLKPDLIITDLRMPNKAGQDFIREIKSIEGLNEVPVAVLSGFTEEFVKMEPMLRHEVVALMGKNELYADFPKFLAEIKRLCASIRMH
ncbi:MAG TPA: response regulator [Patescibacteria group bacterium]|nr:response regulator [Patescibacteria group bacterium]